MSKKKAARAPGLRRLVLPCAAMALRKKLLVLPEKRSGIKASRSNLSRGVTNTTSWVDCLMKDDHYVKSILHSDSKGLLFLGALDYISIAHRAFCILHMIIGAMVIGNIHMATIFNSLLSRALTQMSGAITHDVKAVYPEPFALKPERFLTKMECLKTTTIWIRANLPPSPFKFILTITQNLCGTACCKRNCRYS